jgi:phospholipid-transporting ATPase
MDFKKFSVGNFKYGETDPVIDKEKMKKDGITNVNFSDPSLKSHLMEPQHENFERVHRFMEILSVCHTVIAEKSKNSTNPDNLSYNASSPDELALVNAAKFFGYDFKGRDDDNNIIVEVKNT